MKRSWLLLLGSLMFTAAVSAQDGPPVKLNEYVDQLETIRNGRHEDLRKNGGAANTRKNHLEIDKRYLESTRRAEGIRETGLDEISHKAKTGKIRQGPYGTEPHLGRGGAGDIDTANVTKAEQIRIEKAALNKGYTVETHGDAITIKELNTTVHAEKSPYKSPLGSSARDVEIAQGFGKETSLGYNKVVENMTKGSHTLDKPVSKMTNADFQELAKMTGRNMENSGVKDPGFKKACDMLKGGMSPDSVIVRDGATSGEALKIKQSFKKQCEITNIKAMRNANKQAAAVENSLKSIVKSKQKAYQQAKASGSPNSKAVQQAKARFESSQSQLIKHQAQQAGAKETFIKNQPNAVEMLNKTGHKSIKKVVGSNGKTYYQDLQTGKRYSPSQAKEMALGNGRQKLADTVRTQPGGKQPVTAKVVFFKTATYGLIGNSLYQGSKQAKEDLIRDGSVHKDGIFKLWVKGSAKTVWYATGIPHAIDTGTKAGNEAMDQYNKEKVAGKDPSWIWAKMKGAGTGVFKFCKGMTWDVGWAAGTAVKEGKGVFFDDPAMVKQAEEDLKASEKMMALYQEKKKVMEQTSKLLDQKVEEFDAAEAEEEDDEPDPFEQELQNMKEEMIAELEKELEEEAKTDMVIGENGVQFVEKDEPGEQKIWDDTTGDEQKTWDDMAGEEKQTALVQGESGAWPGHVDAIINAQKQPVPAGLDGEPDLPEVTDADEVNVGSEYDKQHAVTQSEKVSAAGALSSAQQQIGQASTVGDQRVETAEATVSGAGADAWQTQKESVTATTQADQESSWGTVGGDIVQGIVTDAGTATAGGFAHTGAENVSSKIWGEEEEKPTQVADAGGTAGGATTPGGTPPGGTTAGTTPATGGAVGGTGGGSDCTALRQRIIRLRNQVQSKAEQYAKQKLQGGNPSMGSLKAQSNRLSALQAQYRQECGPLDAAMQTTGQIETAQGTTQGPAGTKETKPPPQVAPPSNTVTCSRCGNEAQKGVLSKGYENYVWNECGETDPDTGVRRITKPAIMGRYRCPRCKHIW